MKRPGAPWRFVGSEPPRTHPGATPDPDDDLLVLLRQTEARERMFRAIAEADDEEEVVEPSGDACPHCGEASLKYAACDVCAEDGCLPRDDWRPGWGEPCLTRCSRCGVLHHVDCGGRSYEGNPVCLTCGPAMLREEDE